MKSRDHYKSMGEIAALAKVSKPTVSRAIRGSPLVKEETRNRILAIAAKYGYVVDRNAQKLREKRTNTIAVIADFDACPGGRIHDPFAFRLLADVSQALSMRGQDLLLCSSGSNNIDAFKALVRGRCADGIIFLGQGRRDATLWEMAPTGIPFVVWGAVTDGQPYCAIGGDNVRGGELVAERFLALQRCRPLYVGAADDKHLEMRARRQGFENIWVRQSPAIEPEQLILPDFTYEAALAMLDAHLASGSVIPDSIFSASDTIAMGVYAALEKHGLCIPKDVSVIGYNDNPYAAWCRPALTTVRQDTRQAAALLVEQLMISLEGGLSRSIVMPAELVVRQS